MHTFSKQNKTRLQKSFGEHHNVNPAKDSFNGRELHTDYVSNCYQHHVEDKSRIAHLEAQIDDAKKAINGICNELRYFVPREQVTFNDGSGEVSSNLANLSYLCHMLTHQNSSMSEEIKKLKIKISEMDTRHTEQLHMLKENTSKEKEEMNYLVYEKTLDEKKLQVEIEMLKSEIARSSSRADLAQTEKLQLESQLKQLENNKDKSENETKTMTNFILNVGDPETPLTPRFRNSHRLLREGDLKKELQGKLKRLQNEDRDKETMKWKDRATNLEGTVGNLNTQVNELTHSVKSLKRLLQKKLAEKSNESKTAKFNATEPLIGSTEAQGKPISWNSTLRL